MNYYCYIAGLPDIQIDNKKSAPSLKQLNEELRQLLSKSDMKLYNLLCMEFDNENLIKYLGNKDSILNDMAILTAKDWEEITTKIDESDELNPVRDNRLLPYTIQFYKAYQEMKNGDKMQFPEELIAALYYAHGVKSKNKFLSEWFNLNLNINNILTALTCRKYDWDIKGSIIGDTPIANTIKQSTTIRDFNLKNSLDYYDTIVNIFETENLLERERKIDAFKWAWLDEQTFFEHFSIEKILSFWLRCQIIHRWDNLNQEQGAEIFREMINSLKKEVKFQQL